MGVTLFSITFVALHGRIIPPNEKFTCDEAYAKKLIAGGSAKVYNAENEQKQAENEHKQSKNEQDLAGNEQKQAGNSTVKSPSREELIALFEKNKREILVDIAGNHTIEVKSDDTKAVIAGKLVDAGVLPDA